jgi:hypothetical protein
VLISFTVTIFSNSPILLSSSFNVLVNLLIYKIASKLYILKQLNDSNPSLLVGLSPSAKLVLVSNCHAKKSPIRRKSHLVYDSSDLQAYFLLNLNVSQIVKLSFVYNDPSIRGPSNQNVAVKRRVQSRNPDAFFNLKSFIGLFLCLSPNTNFSILTPRSKVLFV